MKHKAYFRLALKITGVALLAIGLPELVHKIIGWLPHLVEAKSMQGQAPNPYVRSFAWATLIAGVSSPFVQVGLGLYFLFGGKWLVKKAFPFSLCSCPDCGYDVSGASTEQCPECGSQLPTNVRKMIED